MFNLVKIPVSTMTTGFFTGLYRYFFFVKMLIDFTRFITSIIFIAL